MMTVSFEARCACLGSGRAQQSSVRGERIENINGRSGGDILILIVGCGQTISKLSRGGVGKHAADVGGQSNWRIRGGVESKSENARPEFQSVDRRIIISNDDNPLLDGRGGREPHAEPMDG
jgi:hypothetical protein